MATVCYLLWPFHHEVLSHQLFSSHRDSCTKADLCLCSHMHAPAKLILVRGLKERKQCSKTTTRLTGMGIFHGVFLPHSAGHMPQIICSIMSLLKKVYWLLDGKKFRNWELQSILCCWCPTQLIPCCAARKHQLFFCLNSTDSVRPNKMCDQNPQLQIALASQGKTTIWFGNINCKRPCASSLSKTTGCTGTLSGIRHTQV